MAQHRPRLNVFGRQLLVRRITEEHWPVALAAEAAGVSRATAYKWLARYRTEGEVASSTAAPGRTARPGAWPRSSRRPSSGPGSAALPHRLAPHPVRPSARSSPPASGGWPTPTVPPGPRSAMSASIPVSCSIRTTRSSGASRPGVGTASSDESGHRHLRAAATTTSRCSSTTRPGSPTWRSSPTSRAPAPPGPSPRRPSSSLSTACASSGS